MFKWKTHIFHCSKCHHEWEKATTDQTKCDWCGADGYELKRRRKMLIDEKQKLMDISRDIYIEFIRRGRNFPSDNGFISIVTDVKAGYELLDKDAKDE